MQGISAFASEVQRKDPGAEQARRSARSDLALKAMPKPESQSTKNPPTSETHSLKPLRPKRSLIPKYEGLHPLGLQGLYVFLSVALGSGVLCV